MRMKVNLCHYEDDGKRWQEFVDRQIQSTYCHRWNWKQVIENSFGWPTYYLMAEDGSPHRLAEELALRQLSFVAALFECRRNPGGDGTR